MTDRGGRGYCNLVKELQERDSSSFSNFLRLPKELFEDPTSRTYQLLQRRDTNLRTAISIEERLALTLRFLATGIGTNVNNLVLASHFLS